MDAYYRRTQSRIIEYCGGVEGSPEQWDSEFAVCGTEQDTAFRFLDNAELSSCLEAGADVYRSLWSRRGSLFFLDLEYKNRSDEEEIYRNGPQIFEAFIEPVYRELCSQLLASSVSFITVMTGTGYHLVFSAPFNTSGHRRLERLGEPCQELLNQYGRVFASGHRRRPVPRECGLAFDAMGRLAELLVKGLRCDPGIPVEVGIHQPRQIVLDLSTYADPLHWRFLRCVGSYHQKSKRRRFATLIRKPAAGEELSLPVALDLMRQPHRAAPHIRDQSAVIPAAGDGLHELISLYEASELHRRHRSFEAHRPEAEEMRRARALLAGWNDRELASDSGLRRAVRHARQEGISAKALGYAVAERYKRAEWSSPMMVWADAETDGYNPYSRALFWARLFST